MGAGGGEREDVALSYVDANSGCVAASWLCVLCEPVCVCVSLVRAVIICLASTHTALVSSPSLAVLHLSTYLPTYLALTNIPGGGLLTGFAMRSDPNVAFFSV